MTGRGERRVLRPAAQERVEPRGQRVQPDAVRRVDPRARVALALRRGGPRRAAAARRRRAAARPTTSTRRACGGCRSRRRAAPQTSPWRNPNPGSPATSTSVASVPVRPRRFSRRWVPWVNACRCGLRSRRWRPPRSSSSVAWAGTGNATVSPSTTQRPFVVVGDGGALPEETALGQLQLQQQAHPRPVVGGVHEERAVVELGRPDRERRVDEPAVPVHRQPGGAQPAGGVLREEGQRHRVVLGVRDLLVALGVGERDEVRLRRLAEVGAPVHDPRQRRPAQVQDHARARCPQVRDRHAQQPTTPPPRSRCSALRWLRCPSAQREGLETMVTCAQRCGWFRQAQPAVLRPRPRPSPPGGRGAAGDGAAGWTR